MTFRMYGLRSRLRSSTAALLLCGLLAAVLPPVPLAHATASWLNGWSYRQAITVDNAGMTATLTSFPLYVPLASDGAGAGIGSKVRDDGYDIRFTSSDGATLLPYERESYSEASGNATGDFWVGVTLNADNDAATDDTIYLYYGNAGAVDGKDVANGSNDVWDSNFKGVWHLSGATLSALDSTGNSNDGTNNGATATTGKVGNGGSFDGSNDRIVIPDSASWDVSTGSFSISMWFKKTSEARGDIFNKKSADANDDVGLILQDDETMDVYFKIDTVGDIMVSNGNVFSLNAWHYATMVRDGSSNLTTSIDGAPDGTGTSGGNMNNNSADIWIGSNHDNDMVPSLPHTGLIDEIRISNIARSAAWTSFEYNNMNTAGNKLTSATEEGVVSTWSNRKTITVQNANVTSDLTNFPLLVKINQDTNIGGASQSDGDDIRFTDADGRTLLPYEREDYRVRSGSGSGNFWVKVPTIKASGSGNGSGATIYLYYGKADAADGQDATNVWDASFEGVWHLKETATDEQTTADLHQDATLNNNDGDQTGNTTTTGKIFNAQDFDGTDYIGLGNPDSLNISGTAARTVSAWVNTDTVSSNWLTAVSGDKSGGGQLYRLQLDDTASPNRKIAFVMKNSAGTDQVIRSSSALAVGTWYHIAAVYDGTQMLLYFNGLQSGTPITMTPLSDSLAEADIGAHSGHDQNWNGNIDEVRISSATRTAAWIKFEYYNMGEADNELTWSDSTAPTVSTLSPADNATGVSISANLVISFDEAVDPEAGAANDITIKKSSDNSTVETIDAQDAKITGGGSATITINPAATLAESTEYYVLIGADAFDDAAGNSYAGISSTTAWSFTTADITGPTISETAATAGSAGADIAWTTNEGASSRVQYGTTSALGSATTEADTGAGVTSHSVTLSGLPVCTTYFYRPLSKDPSLNAATGSTLSFTTTGCTNSATVSSQTGSSIATTGGSLSMTSGGSGAALTVPASAATNTFTLQIKKIDKATVIAATSTPSGTSTIGDHTYDIRAISGSTLVTSFLQAITVTMAYTDAQVSGYDESSLRIHRWDGSAWNALSSCAVDTSANTVTCTTTHFSTFGLFGTALTSGGTSATTTTQGTGGRRGTHENMAVRIAAAQTAILARYEGRRQESITIANSQQSSSRQQWSEQLAAGREAEIVARIAQRLARIAAIEQTKRDFEQKFALHLEERMAKAAEDEQKKIDAEQRALLAEQAALKAEQETNAQRRAERLAAREKQDALEHTQEVLAAREREARIAQRISDRKAEIARIEQTKKDFEEKYALHLEERMAKAAEDEQKKLDEAKAALFAEQEALRTEQEANAQRREERLAAYELKNTQKLMGAALSLEELAARRDRLYAVVDQTPVLYADVPLSAWYAPYVSFMVEEKIATGYADATGKLKGEFGVTNPVSFAEVLKMAWNAAENDLGALPPPRNVSAQGTWASIFVAQAEDMSLSVFTPNLNVNTPASRGAVIQIILEVLKLPIANQNPSFSDVPNDHPYAHAIATASFYGLITGDTNADGNALGTFRPDAPITRAEVAKVIALVKETISAK